MALYTLALPYALENSKLGINEGNVIDNVHFGSFRCRACSTIAVSIGSEIRKFQPLGLFRYRSNLMQTLEFDGDAGKDILAMACLPHLPEPLGEENQDAPPEGGVADSPIVKLISRTVLLLVVIFIAPARD